MPVTLEEILAAVGARLAVVSAETAGYLVLGALEQGGRLDTVSRDAIAVTEDGSVRIASTEGSAPSDVVEKGLRVHLGDLLARAPGGRGALGRIATSEPRGLARLAAELEAALIPLNRAAARRALARLCRDVGRARDGGKLPQLPPPLPEAQSEVPRPVFVAAQEESPAHTPWSVVTPLPSPLPVSTNPVDRTPFLGGWPAVIADAQRAPAAEPSDTDRAPEVRSEEATWPLFRRASAP